VVRRTRRKHSCEYTRPRVGNPWHYLGHSPSQTDSFERCPRRCCRGSRTSSGVAHRLDGSPKQSSSGNCAPSKNQLARKSRPTECPFSRTGTVCVALQVESVWFCTSPVHTRSHASGGIQ
jgi:hypothetical protein